MSDARRGPTAFTAWNTDRGSFTLEVVGALAEHDWTGGVAAHGSGELTDRSCPWTTWSS